MDAINSLVGGLQRSQATFDGAAQQLAGADLPTAANPDPTNPAAPAPSAANNVDVAEQLTTMMVAADSHHLTTVALRAALSMYRDSLELAKTDS